MDGTISLKRRLPDDFDNGDCWTSYFQSSLGYNTTGPALESLGQVQQKYPYLALQAGQGTQTFAFFPNPPTQRPKRRRLNQNPSTTAMPLCIGCPVDHELEKSGDSAPLLGSHAPDGIISPRFASSLRGASLLGTAAEGVVDFLSTLAVCQPSDHVSNTAFPVPEPEPELRHTGTTPFSVQAEMSSMVPFQGYTGSLVPAPTEENWLSGNTTDLATSIQGFPALQPMSSQPMSSPVNDQFNSLQPSLHLDMTYPVSQQFLTHPTESFQSIPPVQTGNQCLPAGFQTNFDTSGLENMLFLESANQAVLSTSTAFIPQDASYTTQLYPTSLDDCVPFAPVPVTQNCVASTSIVAAPSSHVVSTLPRNAMPEYPQQNLLDQVLAASYMVNANAPHAKAPPKPPVTRRGPFKDHDERQRTAETRKIGSCVRCRMQRVRCNTDPNDVSGECTGCKKSLSRAWRLPCMRLKIGDIVLAKTAQVKGHEWTLRWKENTIVDNIDQWASSSTRIVRITEGYTGAFVELKVRQFTPQKGDSLERSWVTPTGQTRSVNIPPYAIVEPETIGVQYTNYIQTHVRSCCVNLLYHSTSLIWQTYNRALWLAQSSNPTLTNQERGLLEKTLQLWMSVRLTTRSFEIVGDETLGMPRDILDDETNPSRGKIPVPPVMGAQIDSVIIHDIQARLRHDVLDGLQKLITENKARSWFTSYLVIFILLHNAALVIKHDAGYAKKHGMKRRFAREEKVKQYDIGAITLLSYFHYCNKGIFPFTEDAREQDIRNVANLDDETMQFVYYTRGCVIEEQSRWQALWETNAYEDELYFVSQLFVPNWQPRHMVI